MRIAKQHSHRQPELWYEHRDATYYKKQGIITNHVRNNADTVHVFTIRFDRKKTLKSVPIVPETGYKDRSRHDSLGLHQQYKI